jgi:hypothetical protein
VVNYRLGGFDPLGYHVGNFAVHLLTAIGVFALALTLCRTPRLNAGWPPRRALVLATAAGLLFACHPLQTQAVTYIVQRAASMAALFYVWAIVCYLRARLRQQAIVSGDARPYVVACAGLALCSVLSKENAVSLPIALGLSEWLGFGRPRRWRAWLIGAAAALVVVAVPVLWRATHAPPAMQSAPWLRRLLGAVAAPVSSAALPDSRAEARAYLLTQATVLPRYLGLVVRPWGLNVDHDVPIAHALSLPVLGGAALLGGLAALGLLQVRRRPFAAFAILWLFVTLSVESSVIPLDDVMMEHRMYLPMAGLAVGVGWLFAAAVERAPRLAWPAGIAAVAALIALTFARNVVWQSPITLWLDAAEKSPGKVRPQVNLGAAYHKNAQLADAVDHYCRALALKPDDPLARGNLALALSMQGKVADDDVEDVTAYCPVPPP